ncbi:MAG: NTP transferase domain-containing protein, partial [Clostridiaceae bacterium]|nr:NTP transferase domain-containing protein [Clostridiaceae bacterium]
MNKTIALITAAGNGQRMNHTENKLFLKIKGMSIIQRTVQTFLKINSIERLYLTVQSQELNKMQDELKNLDGSNKLRFVIGG